MPYYTEYNNGEGIEVFYERTFSEKGFGLKPFLGASYFITNRITISVETTLSFKYFIQKSRGDYFLGVYPNYDIPGGTNLWWTLKDYNIKFNPFSVINLTFNF
jgi:hypothetical protein